MNPIAQAANSLAATNIYEKVTDWTDDVIDDLFGLSDNIFTDFASLMTICATIYVALMGYAMLSGRIGMSPQEAMIRVSKLVIVVMLFSTYAEVAGFFYEILFTVPEAIAGNIANTLNSAVANDTYTINTLAQSMGATPITGNRGDLGNIVAAHSTVVGIFTALYVEVNDPQGVSDMVIWFIGMAPVIATVAILVVARFMMTVLLFILPIIAIASLFGRGFGVLGTWFKVMLTLGLTIILTYVAFAVLIVLMTTAILSTTLEAGIVAMIAAAASGNPDVPLFTLYDLAPLGVLALVVFIIISQMPNIAGSIVGASGINNQQVSGFINIGALRAAG